METMIAAVWEAMRGPSSLSSADKTLRLAYPVFHFFVQDIYMEAGDKLQNLWWALI